MLSGCTDKSLKVSETLIRIDRYSQGRSESLLVTAESNMLVSVSKRLIWMANLVLHLKISINTQFYMDYIE